MLQNVINNLSLVCCSNSHSPSPPSSSNAFSLLSSEQDNPSTSGCSSEESAKTKTQKELLRTAKQLRHLLPADKRNKGNKSSSLNTLKYALRCIKQVEGKRQPNRTSFWVVVLNI